MTLADVKNPKLANKNSVSEVEFAQMNHTVNSAEIYEKKNLNLLLDIKLGLIVELGRSEMQLRDILKLTKGSVIELDRLSGEPVDLFVNNKIIARGEVVVIDDSFGLRITQLAGNIELSSELGLTVGA
jgi:flagellar motor switch protein FliN/FliY